MTFVLFQQALVIDEEYLLVTSANFTAAAHERNIEAGMMLRDKAAAKALSSQFETLATKRVLQLLEIDSF